MGGGPIVVIFPMLIPLYLIALSSTFWPTEDELWILPLRSTKRTKSLGLIALAAVATLAYFLFGLVAPGGGGAAPAWNWFFLWVGIGLAISALQGMMHMRPDVGRREIRL
ncbi:MAG TPA: hypothetical protein VJ547_10175 [Candidatus Thermoplasmatota archaeon]|nr:hypothetical protein [Candidatus Thermoplasmatota archaeon]